MKIFPNFSSNFFVCFTFSSLIHLTNFCLLFWLNEKFYYFYVAFSSLATGFPGGSAVKNPSAIQERRPRSLGWEDPLEKEMATHSSVFAWRIPWTEKPGGLLFLGLQKSWMWLSHKTTWSPLTLDPGSCLPSNGRPCHICHYNWSWWLPPA